MKRHRSTIILLIIFLAGLSLLLYPTVSDYVNTHIQLQAINSYEEALNNTDSSILDELWDSAVAYNEELAKRGGTLSLTEAEEIEYNKQLTLPSGGPISYIEIPSINCTLPIYHGTDGDVLQVAIGHLEGSSLPVGGPSTHCVLSGHRGLASARLFTDLDQLVVGDIFRLYTLGVPLTYEVDQILIVEPSDVEALRIVEGEDYCTLVTCTPYGVNTHRLLVRGHRVEEEEGVTLLRVTADAVKIDPLIVAPFVAVPVLILILIVVFSVGSRHGGGGNPENPEQEQPKKKKKRKFRQKKKPKERKEPNDET